MTALTQPVRTLVLGSLVLLMTACQGAGQVNEPSEAEALAILISNTQDAASANLGVSPKAASATPQSPILFVTQVPTAGDTFASRLSTFANHMSTIGSVPRGGDLMIRYPDGSTRNLTKEAGFGMEGLQGDKAIAVREPAVHWDGQKAIFSMLIGAPKQYVHATNPWQLYEITGLAKGQTAVITKVAGQPAYNNVSPLYASDDRILFTSDRPMGGAAHLYPHLDEYESTPTISGIYSLKPDTGQLALLNHTPSGAFSPSIDSFGRLIFTRWDHLQRDQQAEAGGVGAHNYETEAAGQPKIAEFENFPEHREGMSSPYGAVDGLTFNLFTPWQMNQDGTGELTMNHIGRHELSFGYMGKSFLNDNALTDTANLAPIANKKHIRIDGGLFNLREDPNEPGIFYGVYAREFYQGTTNQIVRLTGNPALNAEQMTVIDASPVDNGSGLPGGRFRNPLPMANGPMVASYTPSAMFGPGVGLRLHQLTKDGGGMFVAGAALTPGFTKSVSWYSPDTLKTFNGVLWEIEPVEVVARTRPAASTSAIALREKEVLTEEYINEAALTAWMKTNNLALIVTRNQTHRDRGDRQQPYNLQVPGGVKTVGGAGMVYDIAHFQVVQGNQVRGYDVIGPGRRTLGQPMATGKNLPNPGGPPGSVKIASDGSTAAFVPANRALSWQTTDASGTPIVRERVWINLQPGEIRTCEGCHGQNAKNQAGGAMADNKPQALRDLLRYWKSQNPSGPIRLNGSQPLVH